MSIVRKKLVVEFEIFALSDDVKDDSPHICSGCPWGTSLLDFKSTDMNNEVNCPFYEACRRNGCCAPNFKGFKIVPNEE